MKKSFSLFLFVGLFGAFITQNSVANSSIHSGMTAKDDNDVCPWTRYGEPNLQADCGSDKKVNDICEQAGTGAGKEAICKHFNNGSLRCVARKCPGGQYMPLVFEKLEDFKKEENARILGYCYTEQQAKKMCDKTCLQGGKCEPKIVSHTEANNMLKERYKTFIEMTGGQAFVGCVCKTCEGAQKDVVCDTGGCKFVGKITVTCKALGVSHVIDNVVVDIAKNDTSEQIIDKAKKQYNRQIADTIAKCDDKNEDVAVAVGESAPNSTTLASGGTASVGKNANADSDKIRAAQTRLKEFFSKVDSDKSVWKNADGSFNGVRLASDLTAGVVLGTVGGVVSGVLIKKSQVEKGFDALNCTVGGQKIADWGDEFTVGLRR